MSPPVPDVQALLARLRSEPPQPSSAVEEELREERLSRRIDQHVAALDVRRRLKTQRKRIGVALLMAAGVAFASVRVWAPQSRPLLLAIDREPPLRRALAPAAESLPSAPSPERVGASLPAPSSARPRASAHPSEPVSADAKPLELGFAAAPGAAAPAEPSLSTLSEENQLFQSAAQAERAGDSGTALARLAELLSSFPRSPIAQNAMVRKFRLLARVGRTAEASQAAAEYLRAFPQGFAEREARRTVTADAAEPNTK